MPGYKLKKDSKNVVVPFYDQSDPLYSLTNFSRHPFKVDGRTFHTSEHYFQARKIWRNPDYTQAQQDAYLNEILKSKHPRHALNTADLWTGKVSLSQAAIDVGMKPWDSKQINDWDAQKIDIMREALDLKLKAHPKIKDELLSTGNTCLVEDTYITDDITWGWGDSGKGKNLLGILWMEKRNELLKAAGKQIIDPAKLYHEVSVERQTLPQNKSRLANYAQQVAIPQIHPSSALASRVSQLTEGSHAASTQFGSGHTPPAGGLSSAFTHAQKPKTSEIIAGVTKEKLMAVLSGKDKLPEGAEKGIVVSQTQTSPDQVGVTTFVIKDVTKQSVTESLRSGAEQKQIVELTAKIQNLTKEIAKAEPKSGTSSASLEDENKKYKDVVAARAKIEELVKEEAIKKQKFEAELAEWQKKKETLQAKAKAFVKQKNKGRRNPIFADQVNKAKAFISSSKDNVPFPNSEKDHNAERLNHAHTIKQMYLYIKNQKDPSFGDPSMYTTDRSFYDRGKGYPDGYPQTQEDLKRMFEDYDQSLKINLEADAKAETEYVAENITGPQPQYVPIKIPVLPELPPLPSPLNIQSEQDKKSLQDLKDKLTQTESELKAINDAAPASKVVTNMQEKQIGKITHEGNTAKIYVQNAEDTQKVFESIKGLKGKAVIKYPDTNNPTVATEMAIHTILTLDMVPTFDPPWPQPKVGDTPTAPQPLVGLCKKLQEAVNNHDYSKTPDPAQAKLNAQKSFNDFIDNNGIKLEKDMKFKLPIPTPAATATTAADEPIVLTSHRNPSV